MTKELLLVNHFVPPDQSPTAKLFQDLADWASQDLDPAWKVRYLSASQNYRVKASPVSKSRLKRDLNAHRVLFTQFRQRCQTRRPDLVISLTDPPCLAATISWLCNRYQIPHLHWVMDLYPQIAYQLDEIPLRPLLNPILSSIQKWAYLQCDQVIALDEDMKLELHRAGAANVSVCPPWPPVLHCNESDSHHPTSRPKSRYEFLYSGNLGQVHDWQTLLECHARIEAHELPIDLVFQGGGAHLENVKRWVNERHLQHVKFRSYAPESQLIPTLLQADLLIATQKTECQGLLWPSKLAVASQLERPILWIGPPEGSVAAWLRQQMPTEKLGIFAPGESEKMALWMKQFSETTPIHHRQNHPDLLLSIQERLTQLRLNGKSFWSNLLASYEKLSG